MINGHNSSSKQKGAIAFSPTTEQSTNEILKRMTGFNHDDWCLIPWHLHAVHWRYRPQHCLRI